MNFDLTDERQMLQDGLRRYLGDAYTPASVSAIDAAERGFSPAIWQGLAEMGVIGALFGEGDGGFGGAGFDIALVFEEMGRIGAVDPLLDTAILGGGLLAALGTDAQVSSVRDVIDGTMHLALAHGEPTSRYDLTRVTTTAQKTPTGYRLDGRKAVVVNAPAADMIIVSARTNGNMAEANGISLFLLPADTPGLTLRSYPMAGGGQAAEIVLDGVEIGNAARLGPENAALGALETATARAILAISAEALGLMEAIRALTTDYLKTRKQFGKPIGQFQALQHRMADMLIEIEQARSAVINLAGHIDAPAALRDTHVSATKNLIGIVAKQVVEESIQMHGGIGMTQEYALGHLAKRLTMVDHRFGDTTHHLERFITLAVA